MNKLALLALAAFVALGLALASCTTAPTQANAPAFPAIPALSPQQIATQICPALQVTIAGMEGIVGLPDGTYAQLKSAQSSATILCATASTLSNADVQSLEQLAFTTVLPLVEAGNPKLAAELEIVQLAVGFVNAVQASAQAGGTSTTDSNAKPAPAK